MDKHSGREFIEPGRGGGVLQLYSDRPKEYDAWNIGIGEEKYMDRIGDLEVVDSGPGIADKDLEKVCEPFFTRKAKGTGLGLAVVEKIADLHGGSVSIGNVPGGGARAAFHLPWRGSEPE